MSKIEEQIKELKQKLKKIEFLTHILDSAKKYDHKDFKDVKEDVVSLLEDFVSNAITSIENGGKPKVTAQVVTASQNPGTFSDEAKPVQTAQQKESVEKADVNAIAAFAMDNRHLSGKTVSVANDQNMDVKGEVVGLEYPNVLVQTNDRIIKVPRDKVSLV